MTTLNRRGQLLGCTFPSETSLVVSCLWVLGEDHSGLSPQCLSLTIAQGMDDCVLCLRTPVCPESPRRSKVVPVKIWWFVSSLVHGEKNQRVNVHRLVSVGTLAGTRSDLQLNFLTSDPKTVLGYVLLVRKLNCSIFEGTLTLSGPIE